uniref:Uncharacterized protein n=1 Tax=Triticum urartu TaxID=4572 RepID=A0A8R7PEJ9_TRIUA
GYRQCDGAATAASTTTARRSWCSSPYAALHAVMPPPPNYTKGLTEEKLELMNEPGEVLIRWCYSL